MTVAIGGRLEASDVVAVAGGAPVSFGDDARAKVASARVVIDDAVASGATIYGGHDRVRGARPHPCRSGAGLDVAARHRAIARDCRGHAPAA